MRCQQCGIAIADHTPLAIAECVWHRATDRVRLLEMKARRADAELFAVRQRITDIGAELASAQAAAAARAREYQQLCDEVASPPTVAEPAGPRTEMQQYIESLERKRPAVNYRIVTMVEKHAGRTITHRTMVEVLDATGRRSISQQLFDGDTGARIPEGA